MTRRTGVAVLLAAGLVLTQTGCLLTKVLTVPMRVTGAVISVIPVAGNAVDESVDMAADSIDELPF